MKNTNDNDIENILLEFMNQASEEELIELHNLLREKDEGTNGPGTMNFNKIARDMASNIQEQMGLTTENLKRTAKDVVIKFARKYKPDIADKELSAIVREMVPDRKKQERLLPPDLVLTMIGHFVRYSQGKMSQHELNDMPEGWVQKYWISFPMMIQKLIAAYTKEQITGDEFWKSVAKYLKES